MTKTSEAGLADDLADLSHLARSLLRSGQHELQFTVPSEGTVPSFPVIKTSCTGVRVLARALSLLRQLELSCHFPVYLYSWNFVPKTNWINKRITADRQYKYPSIVYEPPPALRACRAS